MKPDGSFSGEQNGLKPMKLQEEEQHRQNRINQAENDRQQAMNKPNCCRECKGSRPKDFGTPCHTCTCHKVDVSVRELAMRQRPYEDPLRSYQDSNASGKPSEWKEGEFTAMNIVHQIGDLLYETLPPDIAHEHFVKARQLTNDRAIDFAKKLIATAIQAERDRIGKEVEDLREEWRVGASWTQDGIRGLERFDKFLQVIEGV